MYGLLELVTGKEVSEKVQILGYQLGLFIIMGVMMLAAAKGSSINITAEGEDEEAAIRSLEELVQGRFGENE